MRFDVIIVGGGAAGLFCAIEAGKRGRRVAVLERSQQPGRKIVISGGGRCNFTNRTVSPENFISENPHFCKSALARYTPSDFIELVTKHGISYFEKKLGQLFCRESSRQIVDMLLSECRSAGVRVITSCDIKAVKKDESFVVETDSGVFHAASLVVAAGGLSFPKVGATDLGYRIARQFGLSIAETRPSLVPLTSKDADFRSLAGVSVNATVENRRASFNENILFTHRGMSGPAILQISNYWDQGETVTIDLVPGVALGDELRAASGGNKKVENFLAAYVPAKLADRMASKYPQRTSELSSAAITELERSLQEWSIVFSGTEGYDKAEVTRGGVSTAELSSQTMEAKKVPGLYFIGEVVDVTGWLGGYNFQWAWSSGFAAGNSV